MKNISLVTVILLFSTTAFSQVTWEDNNPNANIPLGYLGWNDNTNENLDINQNNTLRQRFTSVNWAGLNGLGVNNASRIHLGLNGNFQNPFSLIHMGTNLNGNLQRPWMNVGLTLGATADILHLGLIERPVPGGPNAQVDAVLAWGCNDDDFVPGAGPDNFRFLFLTPTTANGDGAEQQGRENMRITPMGNVGIGDFSHMPSGLNEQPTEKLDVDGTARLRQMPSESPNVLITGREQDIDPITGDYVLNYLEFPGNDEVFLAGDGTWIENTGEDCDWEIIENVTGIDDVVSGHGNDCYPAGHVGIGITEPEAKLDVFHGENQVNAKDRAINAHWSEPSEGPNYTTAYGIHSFLRRNPGTLFGHGIHSTAMYAIRNFAGYFNAVASENTGSNVGVYGRAINGGETLGEAVGGRFEGFAYNSPLAHSYGVIGVATGGDVAYGVFGGAALGSTANWAGYFSGDVFSTTGNYLGSDAILKQNIQPLEGSMDILNQIQPKTYEFQNEVYSQMNLPSGQHQGVIAQELEEVLPNLVKMTTHPTQYDTLGNEISAAVEFKSVNYVGLIPYLIGGIKEQQAEIQQQEESIAGLQEALANQNELMMQMMDQMEMLQQQINGCCNGDAVPKSFGSSDESAPSANPFGQNELYQNVPNPFRGQTTIRYTLEQGGRAMLNIHDSNGREIAQLENAEQVAGTYSYVWDATGLPAGTYHYSLVVDGELLVKRAIKLQD